MIESYYYKKDLLDYASDFEKRSRSQTWREDSLAKAEKQFFIGMLFVRKLIESVKVTDACKRTSYYVFKATINSSIEIGDFMRHDVMDHIDNAKWIKVKTDVSQICDKVIHSWVNYPTSDEKGGLDGFILTTDKYRNKEIWHVPAKSIVEIFKRFGKDYPTTVTAKRNDEGKLIYYRSE